MSLREHNMTSDQDKSMSEVQKDIPPEVLEYQAKVTRLRKIVRHIRNVQSAAEILSEKLIEKGEFEFAKTLIARSFIHDNSKLTSPIEWEFLNEEATDIERAPAWLNHVKTNDHHPEFWGDINEMPRICIAELVCDLHARSSEMGTDLRSFVKDKFLPRHKISAKGKKYKEMKYFLDLLLDAPF
jgi:hypothetical protein